MSDDDRLEALREENERLRRSLEQAESVARALLSGQLAPGPDLASPLLLEQAQEALRARERQLRAVFDGVADGLVICDERGRWIECNPAARLIVGVGHTAALGRTSAELGLQVDPFAAPTSLGRGGPLRGSTSVQRPDGVERRLEYVATSNFVPDRHLLVLHDVTQQILAELERRELQDQLQHSQRLDAVGRLAGGIAHDFSNVLGVILGHTEMLLQRTAEGARERSRLEAMREAASRGADLTRSLLAFGRRQVMLAERVSLAEIAREMLEMLQRLLGEDIELSCSLPKDGCYVLVDRTQIQQVIVNLAVNARDAMPGGGRLWISVEERDEEPAKPQVELAVRDEGPGLDPETARRIFEPFLTARGPVRGAGLGLSTAYGIVTQSGGTIEVDSSPGHGATFRVRLPRVAPAGDDAPVAAAPPRASTSALRVVLVEDEHSLRLVAKEILEDLGCEVIEAANADEAFERAPGPEAPADLLITDVVMPGLNGRELADRLVQQGRVRRVLFTSGYADDDVLARGVTPAAGGFLQKPYSVASLEGELARLTGRSGSESG